MLLNISNIVKRIIENIELFDEFDKVDLFGSILETDKQSNDIDILLLYSVFKTQMQEKSALPLSKDDAATVQVLGKVLSGENVPVYSHVITKEYRKVLSGNKFGFSAGMIAYLLLVIEKYGILVSYFFESSLQSNDC
jgi:hypothetical protein